MEKETRPSWLAGAFLALGISACGAGARSTGEIVVSRQIVSPEAEGTEESLLRDGDRAMAEGRFADARKIFEVLRATKPKGEHASHVLFELAVANDRLDARKAAGALYQEFAGTYASDPRAKTATLRALDLLAYLEDWGALLTASEGFLASRSLDPVDRITGLGARALARVERGEAETAMRDVQSGLDVVDEISYGKNGRLPPPAAQLQFALGEVRRVRAETIRLAPEAAPDAAAPARAAVPKDFLPKMEARCQGLLDAQSAYAEAMRTTDAHWIAMAGFRVGEMYQALHAELMKIPPTPQAKDTSDEQLFFAIMHVRYRVLLEKGLEMLKRTLVIEERHLDDSPWIKRANVTKGEIERALEEERRVIRTFPWEEATIEKTLALMQKKAALEAEKRQNELFKKTKGP